MTKKITALKGRRATYGDGERVTVGSSSSLKRNRTRKKALLRLVPEGAWSTQAGFVYTVSAPLTRLLCFVALQPQGQWQVLALETPGDATTEEKVLESHAHKIIGSYPHVSEALAAAESFAHHWLKLAKSTQFANCDCPEIS